MHAHSCVVRVALCTKIYIHAQLYKYFYLPTIPEIPVIYRKLIFHPDIPDIFHKSRNFCAEIGRFVAANSYLALRSLRATVLANTV